MAMTIYSFLLALALGVSAPWWLWRMARSGRYREGLRERLGFVPAQLRAAVAGLPAKKTVWVHAVSVGEVLAVERLVAELRARLPGYVVAISTTTATGQNLARERFAGCPVFYFPLDFAFAVRAYLRVLRPALMVLVESEFWPRHLAECERAGVPVAVVNARVSDRSFPRYMRLRWLWKPLLGKVSLFLAQGEESAERLRAIGAPAERVRVSGNLKYDLLPERLSELTLKLGELRGEARMVLAGSTHEGEEHLLLECWPRVLRSYARSILVIAPRHPQRFAAVRHLLDHSGLPWIACTSLSDGVSLQPGSVVLVDTIGDLTSLYRIAQVAFIGGSLVAKGGQNPLEAARFGVPMIMGPSYENFREVVEEMRAFCNRPQLVGLDGTLEDLIDGSRRYKAQDRLRRFYERKSGATHGTVTELVGLIRGAN
jgi:3-deoxy-D-manno-octulosonic-acid transferase